MKFSKQVESIEEYNEILGLLALGGLYAGYKALTANSRAEKTEKQKKWYGKQAKAIFDRFAEKFDALKQSVSRKEDSNSIIRLAKTGTISTIMGKLFPSSPRVKEIKTTEARLAALNNNTAIDYVKKQFNVLINAATNLLRNSASVEAATTRLQPAFAHKLKEKRDESGFYGND